MHYAGVDPSSNYLAAVIMNDKAEIIDYYARDLSKYTDISYKCDVAYDWIKSIVEDDCYVYIEAPVYVPKKGGFVALLPQAKVHGALLAGARSKTNLTVTDVNVMTWKKQVVGKGNASKAEVASWVQSCYPDYHTAVDGRQDALDACAIACYGRIRSNEQPKSQ